MSADSEHPPRYPNLLIIGAMKASTTLLYSLLQQHPAIWFPAVKEPRYFSRQEAEIEAGWQDYRALFAGCPESARYCGEASTTYTRAPHGGPVARRIRERLGAPKLIYILRDPVERTISHYRHSYLGGFYRQGMPIAEALDRDPILLDTSRYEAQLRQYLNVFDESELLILIAEKLHRQAPQELARVEAFLGIDSYRDWQERPPAVNSAAQLGVRNRWLPDHPLAERAKQLMPAPLKRYLQRQFAKTVEIPEIGPRDRQLIAEQVLPDLRALHRRLGPRLGGWASVRQYLA